MSRWIRALIASISLISSVAVAAQEGDELLVPHVSAGSITVLPALKSAYLADMPDVWVWLPPGYTKGDRRRYPVLYMNDGQNAFDRRLTNYDKEWQLDEAITRMSGRGDLREWIVVGIRSPQYRYQTMFPQKLYDYLPASLKQAVDTIELSDSDPRQALRGDAYLAMLTQELKPKVDAMFRTLAGPEDTAIMGSSMGGLISLYAIAEYPEVFGQAAGLSTHIPLVLPDSLDPAVDADIIAGVFGRYFAQTKLDPRRNHIYLDYGTATLDAHYPPYYKAFDAMMVANGWHGPSYESRAFFGAEHDENAWAQRIDIPLGFLDRKDP